jgi:hypothetical protein
MGFELNKPLITEGCMGGRCQALRRKLKEVERFCEIFLDGCYEMHLVHGIKFHFSCEKQEFWGN